MGHPLFHFSGAYKSYLVKLEMHFPYAFIARGCQVIPTKSMSKFYAIATNI